MMRAFCYVVSFVREDQEKERTFHFFPAGQFLGFRVSPDHSISLIDTIASLLACSTSISPFFSETGERSVISDVAALDRFSSLVTIRCASTIRLDEKQAREVEKTKS